MIRPDILSRRDFIKGAASLVAASQLRGLSVGVGFNESDVLTSPEIDVPKHPQLMFVRPSSSVSQAERIQADKTSGCSYLGGDLTPILESKTSEAAAPKQFSRRTFLPGVTTQGPMCEVPTGVGFLGHNEAGYFPEFSGEELIWRKINAGPLTSVAAEFAKIPLDISQYYLKPWDRNQDEPIHPRLLASGSFTNPDRAQREDYGFSEAEWNQIIFPGPGDSTWVDWKGRVDGELARAFELKNKHHLKETGRPLDISLGATDIVYLKPEATASRAPIGELCGKASAYHFHLDHPVISFPLDGKIDVFLALTPFIETTLHCPNLLAYRFVRVATVLKGLGSEELRREIAKDVKRLTREYPSVQLPTISQGPGGYPQVQDREVGIVMIAIGGSLLLMGSMMHDTGMNALIGIRP